MTPKTRLTAPSSELADSRAKSPTKSAVSYLAKLVAEVWHLIRLAIPIIIGLASSTIISVVDTVMISPLGTQALAATSVTTSVLLIFYSGLYGLTAIVGVLIAQAYGAENFRDVSSTVLSGLLLAIVAGVVSTVTMLGLLPLLTLIGQPERTVAVLTPYWIAMAFALIPYTAFYALKGLYDGIDKAWTGVAFSFLGVTINIPVNYLLIHGLGTWEGLGLLGAGVASFIAMSVSFTIAVLYWRYTQTMQKARYLASASLRQVVFQLKEGFPLAISYIANGGAYSLAGLMLGWFGATALAANQVVGSVSSVLYMLPLGMSAAVAIRIGQAVGANKLERLRPIAGAAIAVVIVWMTVAMIGLLLAGSTIATALTTAPDVVALATSMFIVVAGMQILDGVQSTGLGMLRGIMDNRWSVVVTLVGFWFVALPAAYMFGFVLDLGPNGVWIGYGVGLLPIAIALPIRFARLTR